MKIYKTQKEVEKDIVDGVLKINGDVKFECDINIEANIIANDIDANNIDANDINAYDIDAGNINANNIDAGNINANDIDVYDISYWAFCDVYKSISCTSIEGQREPHNEPVCLDGELIIKDKEDDKTEEAIALLKKEGYKIIKEN